MNDLTHQLDHWLGRTVSCRCGRTHAVGTQKALIGDNAGEQLATFAGEHGLGQRVAVVCDANTQPAADVPITALTMGGFKPHTICLSAESQSALVPDEGACDQIIGALQKQPCDWLLGVGAGTINDLCKWVASQQPLPYVAWATAASMNGYTSTIAALKQKGLKVTLPVKPALAVCAHLPTILSAPPEMTAAGFADLLSKYVCNADWILASKLNDQYYCPVPYELASAATDVVVQHVGDIETGQPSGLTVLTQALLLSGISMAAAGSSSPASGGEHLISHYWDMTVPGSGTGRRYHGTQVGLGTLVCATLYEKLLQVEPADIDPERAASRTPAWDDLEADLRAHFRKLADVVIEQARQKYHPPDALRRRVGRIAGMWDDLRKMLRPIVKPAGQIRALLRRAGAPTTFSDIGITLDQARAAILYARHIRARYTVLDLAAEIGMFGPSVRQNLLASIT